MANPTLPTDDAELHAYCMPFLRGEKKPATAAELMASRYVAYATQAVDYILATHDPATRGEADRDATLEWSQRAKFHGLSILSTERGEAGDDTGEVEFKAFFVADGMEHVHHEQSKFVKKDGQWFFSEGKQLLVPLKRSEPKLGRNDPCFCGSGKKLKKCHGTQPGA